MNEFTKNLGLGLGAFVGSAHHHLTKPRIYVVAGAVGLGVKMRSKDNVEALNAAIIASLGIIGYGALSVVPHVVEQAYKDGVIKED